MKKFLISTLIIISSLGILISPALTPIQAKTQATVKKHVVKKKKKKTKKSGTITTMKWTSGALAAVGSLASFDYNYGIRNAYMKKIEASARQKHVKTITASFVNAFRG